MPTRSLLHEQFEATADAFPDAVALSFSDREVTYRDLERWSNRLARFLRTRGVGRGATVGILFRKSPEAYASILAVLKSGAAYVPLDPGYPLERNLFLLSNSRASALLTSSEFVRNLRSFGGSILNLDRLETEISARSAERLDRGETGTAEDDLAYLIYTSGTTGRPKGVQVEHRNAVALVTSERRVFGVRPVDRVAQTAPLAFDLSVEEVWLAFAAGAALVPVPDEVGRGGPELARWLTDRRVSVLSCVPTLLSMVGEGVPSLRLVILGGEVCPTELVDRWYRPGRRLVNTYGPTETTVTATYADLDPRVPVRLGRPLPGWEVRVLDEEKRPVAPGEPGEIYIAGSGVARGYVDLPEETAHRFVELAVDGPGSGTVRAYRTGDLGRFAENGELEFLGRSDGQVKIRGFRVELAEIESVLMRQENVLAAACAVRSEVPGLPLLVGYVVPRDGLGLDLPKIRGALRTALPKYMVPHVLEPVRSLPRLPSGKLDRGALPAPSPRASGGRLPRDALERRIADVWNGLFRPLTVSIDDDFFLDLGGHSLLAARMISELRKDPEFARLSLADVYDHPTVASLARAAERSARTDPPSSRPPPDAAVPGRATPPRARSPARAAAVQALGLYVAYGLRAVEWVTPFLVFFLLWLGGQPLLIATLWAVVSAVVVFPVLLAVSLALKWLVLGRIRPGRYPLWGSFYLRWWFVTTVAGAIPLDYLAGTPLLPAVLRLYGAKVGRDVHLETDGIAAYDLVSIGDRACVDEDASLLGYTVEGGELVLAPVRVGRDCFVGTRAVLREGTEMQDGSRLEDLSLLPPGTVVPAGETWAGSPARNVPRTSGSTPPRSVPLSRRRRAAAPLAYAAMILTIPVLLFVAILPGLFLLLRLEAVYPPLVYALALPVVGASFVVLVMGELVLVKWALLGRLRPGAYRVHGGVYMRNWMVDQLHALSLDLVAPIHATVYVAPWYRALGARVGRSVELSTATSTTPDLLELADGATVADEASLGSPHVERGWMIVAPTRLGRKAFVGNSAVIPSGTDLGDGTLCGVLSRPPEPGAGPVPPGTTWFGSPPIELPRREPSAAYSEERTFAPSRRLKLARHLAEIFRVTIPPAGFVVVTAAVLAATLALVPRFGLLPALLLVPVVYAVSSLLLAFAVAGAKWALMGRYRPFERPLWTGFIWRLEFVNALYEFLATPLALEPLQGTPFLPAYLRLLGAKIGPGVYLNTTGFLEWDLVEVGANAALNDDCVLQTHLFEDRVLKAAPLRIGPGCSVGAYSVVLYGSRMEPSSRLDSLSLLMKGEALPASTAWSGIPARRSAA